MGTVDDFGRGHQESAAADLDLPPVITEKYEVKTCLKMSSEKQVYLAVSKANWRKYIIKAVSKESHERPGEEYEISQTLNHPGIVRAHSYIEGSEYDYLIREYVEGRTVTELVEMTGEGKLSREELLRIGSGLCEVLQYLHTRKPPVIHRDIKPDNIIITEQGECKLIDFGISRKVHKENKADTVIMGSRFAAPPEQYGYAQTDERSDIYSFGMLMYYMATGDTDISEMEKHSIPGDIKKVIIKCVRFSPEQRYSSVRVLKRKLLKLSDYKTPSRRYYLRAGSAVLLFALLCMVRFWWERDPGYGETEEIHSLQIEGVGTGKTAEGNTIGDTGQRSEGGAGQAPLQTGPLLTPVLTGKPERSNTPMLTGEAGLSPGGTPEQKLTLTLTPEPKVSSVPASEAESSLPKMRETAAEEPVMPAAFAKDKEAYSFKSTLIEAAVRDRLGKAKGEVITKEELRQISELYICGQQVYQNWNEHFVYGKSQYMVNSKYNETGLFRKNGEITSLEDIALMENLQTLALYNQNISDLTPLKELHNLQRLGLGRNNIDDLTPLLSLESLSDLDLSGNPITNADIGMLTVLPGLSGLDLGETNVNSIYSIRNIPLKYLSVFECRVGNCEGLEQMTKLETFITTGVNNMITEEAVDRIIMLKDLKDLRLMGCFDFDIAKLGKLTSLELLDLCGAQFDCLGRLYSSSVKILMLSGIPVLDLEGVENFPNVTQISLSASNCSDYTPLLRLKHLKTVNCNTAQAREIKTQLGEVPFEITDY